jgi:hypothetical protein
MLCCCVAFDHKWTYGLPEDLFLAWKVFLPDAVISEHQHNMLTAAAAAAARHFAVTVTVM